MKQYEELSKEIAGRILGWAVALVLLSQSWVKGLPKWDKHSTSVPLFVKCCVDTPMQRLGYFLSERIAVQGNLLYIIAHMLQAALPKLRLDGYLITIKYKWS